MASVMEKLHAFLGTDRARKKFLASCPAFDDPDLYRRLVTVVDVAIATAEPSQTESDTIGGVLHTDVWWRWRRRDVSAQRTIHPGGRTDYMIHVERPDANAGPWLVNLNNKSRLRFMPGAGFDDPAAFLDWFEEGTVTGPALFETGEA